MSQPPPDPRLEEFIAAIARAQPLRRAPATLEERVLRQIAQRAARPWWRLGFSDWPWPVRLLCLPLGAAFVELAFLAGTRVALLWQSWQSSLRYSTLAVSAHSTLQSLADLARAGRTLAALAAQGVAGNWVYGTAAAGLLLYALLFGLGAAAFRALILTPASHRY